MDDALHERLSELHAVCARIDERTTLLGDALERRMDECARDSADAAARVSAIERKIALIQAWSAGAGVVMTAVAGAIAWVVSQPSVWDAIRR